MPSLKQIYSHPKNSFSASHFLIGYGKCERLHGHNYSVKVQLKYHRSDFTSLIDFREINSAIQGEIQSLNQKILIPKDSPEIQIHSTMEGRNWLVVVHKKTYSFPKQDVRILEGIRQTTAECIAMYLHKKLAAWIEKSYPRIVSYLEVSIAENLWNEASFSSTILA